MPLCLHTHLICIYCTRYHLLYLAYAALYHHSFIYLYVHILYPFTLVCIRYSALQKYSAPLNFATFCHISGFKHKDIKLYIFVKNQQQVGHNHEVELTNPKLNQTCGRRCSGQMKPKCNFLATMQNVMFSIKATP